MRPRLVVIILLGALGLSGCASKGLRQLKPTGAGPDEFMILPNKPLTAPKDYDVLPAPTPGGTNLVDQNPMADAIIALGGRDPATQSNAIPASDSTLVTQASRYGVPANTRVILAEEDAKYRKKRGRFSGLKLFPNDRYRDTYNRQILESQAEASRFRRAGLATPSSPPAGN